MKIFVVKTQTLNPEPHGMISSSYRSTYVERKEYFQSRESAEKRSEEIKKAASVIGHSMSVSSAIEELEVLP